MSELPIRIPSTPEAPPFASSPSSYRSRSSVPGSGATPSAYASANSFPSYGSPPSPSESHPSTPVSSDAPLEYPHKFRYQTVTGFFIQDDPHCDAVPYNHETPNFGLKPSPDGDPDYSGWQHFIRNFENLKRRGNYANSHFKLLYIARHGQGVHNVWERNYGTEAWNATFAREEGNVSATWADAKLTPFGITQAQVVSRTWKILIEEGIPLPQSYYVSPLERCLETARSTFGDLELPSSRRFCPMVKEKVREVLGRHTCDRRSNASYLKRNYPDFDFEDGFTEEDELWKPDHRETAEEIDERIRGFLDDIFTNDKGEFISITAHSGTIVSMLRVLGHRPFRLPTAGVIPALVKADRMVAEECRESEQGGL